MTRHLTFIMGLKKSHKAFHNELDFAYRTPMPDYYRFMKALGFYAFIEQVITACVMYPRCIDTCLDNLQDLTYGIYNNLGLGKFHMTRFDQDRMAWLIADAGREVLSILESSGYYFTPEQLPRGMLNDPHYHTDLTAIADISKINNFTFVVEIREQHFDDEIDFPQRAANFPRTSSRSF